MSVLACCLVATQCRNLFSDNRCPSSLYTPGDYTQPYLFTDKLEGPVVDHAGNLYAVNLFRTGTIGKVAPNGEPEMFVELPEGSAGNGMRMDKQGDWFVADVLGKRVLKIVSSSLQIETFAWDSRMAGPNDLAITSKGTLFVSDPIFEEVRRGHVWRVDVNRAVTLLDGDLSAPNGIEVSPCENILYVGEYGKNRILAYDLSPTGEISNKRVLINFPTLDKESGPDGIRCDTTGKLYVALYGGGAVAVVSPEGIEERRIPMAGDKTTNVAFGGGDGRTLYVTVADLGLIQCVKVDQPGRAFHLGHNEGKIPGCPAY